MGVVGGVVVGDGDVQEVVTERQVQVATDVSEVDVVASQLLESRQRALNGDGRKGFEDGCDIFCGAGHEKILRFSGVKILSRSWLTHRN